MDKDGGAFDAAPPPMGGLGNFKGVMLCNRPSDEPASKAPGGGRDGEAPFKSMIAATHGEQLGLPPCRAFEPSVKTRGPSAALRRHVRWLRELQDQMREERGQVEEEDREHLERKLRMKATFEGQREGVRQMMCERDQGRGAAGAKEGAPKGKGTSAKPLWAMTEQEKEDFEDEEANDLINFAENLDYDKFVSDLEFRQGLEALRDRMGRLQKEQDAFKDALAKDVSAKTEEEEGQSTSAGSPRSGVDGTGLLGDLRSEYSCGSSRRSKAEERRTPDGRPEWDSSTSYGDDRPEPSRNAKSAAERVLESAPQMRVIHSKESVQRIIEKAREKQLAPDRPLDLAEHMRQEGPVPVPVIVASSDTQTRLHKTVEPSLLPYLYRSPAI
uniref:Uncharacterized protein n=1 Tax=Alexandrium catenella TaxID=2925 RepID=A0A7S1PVT3_ALECA|mmetsp:Transcript_114017/g.303068  ORF Transcript_114017/g.303068 Transcript_114017/m.303068 type:complete len:385 (+) Transcript_114017:58-1212(+)